MLHRTNEWLSVFAPRIGLEVTFVDGTDVQAYAGAVKSNTTMLYAGDPAPRHHGCWCA